MKTKSRITSILQANSLDFSSSGLPTFNLSELTLASDLEFQLPSNLRLGHLAEKIVSELIKSSTNYQVIHENVQVIEDKKTIGEIDFIIEDKRIKQFIHLEVAYKFYLFDPNISSDPINNWIGPNRNDSLQEKLEKVKSKQFPLLYHKAARTKLNNIGLDQVSQALCLLASLFIPFGYKGNFSTIYEKAIKGYYLNLATFVGLDHSEKTYYLPSKKEWGMDPAENETWAAFNGIEKHLAKSIKEKEPPYVGKSRQTFTWLSLLFGGNFKLLPAYTSSLTKATSIEKTYRFYSIFVSNKASIQTMKSKVKPCEQ